MVIAVWFLSGGILGWLSVFSCYWNVMHLDPACKSQGMFFCASGMFLRLTLITCMLFFAMRSGFFEGLSAIGGLILLRWLALGYRMRRI